MTYRPAFLLRDEPIPPPTELQMQAIWFEQWHEPILATDDGRTVEVIQAGFWNHGPGPDFNRTVIKIHPVQAASTEEPEITLGHVEMHLRAEDWITHGHHLDPAYENTILHVVWEDEPKTFLPVTARLRTIPQVILSRQLVAPWSQLASACRHLSKGPLPQAKPGRCQAELSLLSPTRVTEIVRQAGQYRLEQKARIWFWRNRLVGREQALYEALAEALGFHANQVPLRLLSQRLPYKKMRSLTPQQRLALLFAVAGFLPEKDTAQLAPDVRAWTCSLWEIWWKERSALLYALLKSSDWQFAGLRPLNRPERRIAALGQIIPLLPELIRALNEQQPETFSDLLRNLHDPFWDHRATLKGARWKEPCRLLGEERIQDILINVFWPFIALDDKEAALTGWKKIRSSGNRAAHAATQRILVSLLPKKSLQEGLILQGLLQIFRDYCQTDCSDCQQCRFPELIKNGEI